MTVLTASNPLSFPEHARSQVKGGHSSGEIELIQACGQPRGSKRPWLARLGGGDVGGGDVGLY